MTKTIEFEMDEASATPGRPQVFVLYMPPSTSLALLDRIRLAWQSCWREAGAAHPPMLLALPDAMRLQAASEDDLRSAGLMRVPV